MKLRTAFKIQNLVTCPWRGGNMFHPHGWNDETMRKSRIICRRKAKDRRVPVVPTEEEWAERMIGFKEFERMCKQLN